MTFNEYQEKWLQLMETTKLPQTKMALYDGNGYCCLGLCMRFVENIEPEHDSEGVFWSFDGETCFLTDEAMSHLELRTRFGQLISRTHDFYTHLKKCGYSGRIEFSLASYNDNGATFKQLAAAIRACPEAVFTHFEKREKSNENN